MQSLLGLLSLVQELWGLDRRLFHLALTVLTWAEQGGGGTWKDEEGMLASMWSRAGRTQSTQLLSAEFWIYLPISGVTEANK